MEPTATTVLVVLRAGNLPPAGKSDAGADIQAVGQADQEMIHKNKNHTHTHTKEGVKCTQS